MKKFFVGAICAIIGFNAFALGTINIGVNTDGSNINGTFGYDILVHSFDNSELWVEPRLDCGCMTDNNDNALSFGGGLVVTDVFYSNGFFWGINADWNRAEFEDGAIVSGFAIGAKVGVKMYHTKLSVGIDKGIYFTDGGDKRESGNKYPLMFAINCEYFW